MQTQVHFTHMDRSESLEQFAIEKMEGVAHELLHRGEFHLQIWLVNEKSAQSKGPHQFKCEVSVRFPPKREIFIDKTSEDMYESIGLVENALRQVLREEAKKEIQKRH